MSYNWRQQDIRLYAVIASILISVFTILAAHPVNDDAYTYIRTAEIFLSEGIGPAIEHYEWASYSILIGLTSYLGFDLFTAAYVVNTFFYALLVFAFVSIVKEIDDSKLILLVATVLILLYPELNEYRYLIIRDIGFWAFSLFGLWQYLLYARNKAPRYAVGFALSLLLATAMRMEALAYLLATPFILLLDLRYAIHERRRLFFRLIGISLAALLLAITAFSVFGLDIGDLVVEFASVYQPFLDQTINLDNEQAYELSRALFSEHAASYSQEYLTLFMTAGLLSVLVANLLSGIGGPFSLALIYGFFTKSYRFDRSVAVPVITYLLVSGLILFSFILVTRYLSSRYTMMFCIILSLMLPLIFGRLLEDKQKRKNRRVIAAVAFFFTYCLVDSFFSFGERKDFVNESIEWLAQNTDSNTGLVTNNRAVAYASNKIENYDQTLVNLTPYEILGANQGDLLVIEMRYAMERVLQDQAVADSLSLITAFPSLEEPRMVIYQRISP